MRTKATLDPHQLTQWGRLTSRAGRTYPMSPRGHLLTHCCYLSCCTAMCACCPGALVTALTVQSLWPVSLARQQTSRWLVMLLLLLLFTVGASSGPTLVTTSMQTCKCLQHIYLTHSGEICDSRCRGRVRVHPTWERLKPRTMEMLEAHSYARRIT